MRPIAWGLLLVFVFAIPWQYALDFGPPFGNVARVFGLLALLAAMPGLLETIRPRRLGALQWLALAYLCWWCCTAAWSIDPWNSMGRLPGYAQELMVVWLIWELGETANDLRVLLRCYVGGSWILALISVGAFLLAEGTEQARFFGVGQDPNDAARFLDLALPVAGLLFISERHWVNKLMALGYLPLGLFAVVLTASRGGFVAALVAVAGCAVLLLRHTPRRSRAWLLSLPAVTLMMLAAVPWQTWVRIWSIGDQLNGGDLNQRWSIWRAGWIAFCQAPVAGWGAGSFVSATGLAPEDTAHNTLLSIAVEGGVAACLLAAAILLAVTLAVWRTRGALRVGLATALLVWLATSLVATVEQSRTTWLLFALSAFAGRLERESPGELKMLFSAGAEERLAPLPASV